MTKRLVSFPLVLALMLGVCSTAVFANGPKASEPSTSNETRDAAAKAPAAAKTKLKTDLEKLVTDAKAGKVAPKPQQFPQTSRSNLSKTTKIALIATAIGTSIFLIVLFHDLSKD